MGNFIKENLPDPISYFEAEGLALKGRGLWRTTSCSFHGGRETMRINTANGAWICMSCNAKGGDVLAHHMAEHGLDFVTAAKALGAWQDDGKPDKPHRPKPLPASAALQVIAFECNLAYIAACNIANGVPITDADRARLGVAAQRIQTISEAFHA